MVFCAKKSGSVVQLVYNTILQTQFCLPPPQPNNRKCTGVNYQMKAFSIITATTYQIIEVIIPAVSGVVFPQCSHHDHADKTNQEDDHHEGIEDGEPMDLHGRRNGKDHTGGDETDVPWGANPELCIYDIRTTA
jgi:hypothetical protein